MGNKFSGWIFRVVNHYTLLVDVSYKYTGEAIFNLVEDADQIGKIMEMLNCNKIVIRDVDGISVKKWENGIWVDL